MEAEITAQSAKLSEVSSRLKMYAKLFSHLKLGRAAPKLSRPGLGRRFIGFTGITGGGLALVIAQREAKCDAPMTSGTGVSSQPLFATITPELLHKLKHEAMGTGIIVLLGCGLVASSKFLGSGMNLGGAALGWGTAVALAVYATRDQSGAHLNPAITTALAVFKPDAFAPSLAPLYIGAQIFGGAAAAALNYAVFSQAIKAVEKRDGVVRGAPGSYSVPAGAFGLIPNPSALRAPGALGAEVLATSVLTYMVFQLTDPRSTVPPDAAPVLIGGTVMTLVAVFGPVCGAGMNPARDLGPRLVTLAAGWRGAALHGVGVYTVGPVLGALLGGWAHGQLNPAAVASNV